MAEIIVKLSELPADVLETLRIITEKQDIEDQAIEKALVGAIRDVRLKNRVQPMVLTLLDKHHGLSTLAAIRIAAIKLGISTGYCRNIFYGGDD